ncbi:lipocalin family protein [Tenacibaculum dicentrarchi]|uniref:lipocalin family protein n=1 Tax=Tenacibaculum dicentrarchi TaxID=669041 RepID=UPI000CCADE78|nr:conserved hypothetical protein [Tenacibaculum dicentrarchi]
MKNIKKNLFSLLILAAISTTISCKTTTSAVNTKLDKKTEKMLKGNWTISTVNYTGANLFKVTSFNIADSNCFVGSNWSFISNNNKGQMRLNNPSTSCLNFNSPTTWYVNKDGDFVLKIINSHKAKSVNNGFVLNINNLTQTSFDLVDKINVAGTIKNITYSFQRK